MIKGVFLRGTPTQAQMTTFGAVVIPSRGSGCPPSPPVHSFAGSGIAVCVFAGSGIAVRSQRELNLFSLQF